MLETPDLSKEFNPQPKTFKAKKPPKPLKKSGDKTEEWDDARAELKKIFEDQGITSCELHLKGCWKDNSLGFAHYAKRRKLSKENLMEVALLCNYCHQYIEVLPAKEMEKIIKGIITNRV